MGIEQKRTEQNRTEENRTEQNRREQNRREENRREQNTTKDSHCAMDTQQPTLRIVLVVVFATQWMIIVYPILSNHIIPYDSGEPSKIHVSSIRTSQPRTVPYCPYIYSISPPLASYSSVRASTVLVHLPLTTVTTTGHVRRPLDTVKPSYHDNNHSERGPHNTVKRSVLDAHAARCENTTPVTMHSLLSAQPSTQQAQYPRRICSPASPHLTAATSPAGRAQAHTKPAKIPAMLRCRCPCVHVRLHRQQRPHHRIKSVAPTFILKHIAAARPTAVHSATRSAASERHGTDVARCAADVRQALGVQRW